MTRRRRRVCRIETTIGYNRRLHSQARKNKDSLKRNGILAVGVYNRVIKQGLPHNVARFYIITETEHDAMHYKLAGDNAIKELMETGDVPAHNK